MDALLAALFPVFIATTSIGVVITVLGYLAKEILPGEEAHCIADKVLRTGLVVVVVSCLLFAVSSMLARPASNPARIDEPAAK